MAYKTKEKESYYFFAYNEAKREGVNFDKSPFELTSSERNTLLDIADDIGYKKSSKSSNNMSRVSSFFSFLKKKYHR